MARKKEFIKESEARIIIYLDNAANYMKNASRMADKLDIDYIYVMKLLREMYQKGWVKVHLYNLVSYFDLTKVTPVKEANKRLLKTQLKLGAL